MATTTSDDDFPIDRPSIEHSLDEILSKFDRFIDDRKMINNSDGDRCGLIYAFVPQFDESPKTESTARIDVDALRTWMIARYVREFLRWNNGYDFELATSENRRLFEAMESGLWIGEYNSLIAQDDQSNNSPTTSNDSSNDQPSQSPTDRIASHNDQDRLLRTESARINDRLRSINVATDYRLILIIPEEYQRHIDRLKSLINTDDHRRIAISIIVSGRVRFAHDWTPRSIGDYFDSRRYLIDASYRQRFDGGDRHDPTDQLIDTSNDIGISTTESTKRALTLAAITFELSARPFHRSMTIDRSARRIDHDQDHEEDVLPQWARNGVFVLYNYARLNRILEKYDRGSIDGRFPELVAIDRLDAAIKDKIMDDLGRLCKYLSIDSISGGKFEFATIDQSSRRIRGDRRSNDFESIFPNSRNEIFEFSAQFSRYYSKRRVLTEAIGFDRSNAHALIAKIHVLKRFKELYSLWFRILNIRAVDFI